MPDASPKVRKLLLRWTLALPYLMRSHLLEYKVGADTLGELLTEVEVRLHKVKCGAAIDDANFAAQTQLRVWAGRQLLRVAGDESRVHTHAPFGMLLDLAASQWLHDFVPCMCGSQGREVCVTCCADWLAAAQS